MRRWIAGGIGIGVLLIAWLALSLSSTGVLVGHRLVPAAEARTGADVLRCRYFTGVSVVSIEFPAVVPAEDWHLPTNVMGRSVCPTFYSLQ